MKLKILVGTMTSTADYVAQSIQMECADLVAEIEILMMDGLDISVFDEDALYLICSSTYGSGDVPDNARALYDSLDLNPKFPSALRRAPLGDRTYQTFSSAANTDERLQGLGAQRIGEVWCHDASAGTMPEEPAAQAPGLAGESDPAMRSRLRNPQWHGCGRARSDKTDKGHGDRCTTARRPHHKPAAHRHPARLQRRPTCCVQCRPLRQGGLHRHGQRRALRFAQLQGSRSASPMPCASAASPRRA
jgi:MioC protein